MRFHNSLPAMESKHICPRWQTFMLLICSMCPFFKGHKTSCNVNLRYKDVSQVTIKKKKKNCHQLEWPWTQNAVASLCLSFPHYSVGECPPSHGCGGDQVQYGACISTWKSIKFYTNVKWSDHTHCPQVRSSVPWPWAWHLPHPPHQLQWIEWEP